MSFLNSFKHALGFSDEPEDELLSDSTDPTPEADPEPTHTAAASTATESGVTHDVEPDAAMVQKIFDHAVATFNQALPGFIATAVDQSVQAKQLYDGLDASIKNYLSAVTQQTRQVCEQRFLLEQSELRAEMESIKSKAKEVEQQRFDIKQQQLSSDRQRRALSDRVHDLEGKIAQLEAEREQFDLENKSLVNKLKVASVYESQAAELQESLAYANAEIIKLRNGGYDTAPTATADEAKAQIAELQATVAALEEKNQGLSAELDAAKEKDLIATEMMNGLQSTASSSRSQLAEREKEIEQLRAQLKETNNVQADLELLNKQMTMVEEAMEKRDRKIARLRANCEQLQAEKESLQQTVAANLKKHADDVAELQARIDEMKTDTVAPLDPADLTDTEEETAAETKDTTPKISDYDLAAIEESFDNATWMSSEPTETPSMRSAVNEQDFGYQAPTKKTSCPDNDAQLSLF